MKNQPIRNVYTCRLEALTPLHVGSGDTLRPGFDFFVSQGKVHVVNTPRLFQAVRELGPEKLNNFTTAIEDGGVEEWLKRQGVRLDRIATSSFPKPSGKHIGEIRVQIKDGYGRPYLPGSSIKGALRTAVISKLATEDKTSIKSGSRNPKFADQEVCKALLGKDAKTNLMRTLTVGDFSLKQNDIELYMVWINRLISQQNFSGKFPPICIEGVVRKAEATGTVSLDRFLPQKDAEQGCFNFKVHLSLDWLLTACRELTSHTIESELAFFEGKSGEAVKGIVSFYQSLAEEQKKLAENEAIIQLAWGAGWRGMTGQLLKTKDLNKTIRKELKLAPQGKYLDFPFPKSRRIVAANGVALPMGWARISFISKEEVLQQEKERKEQQIILRQEEDRQLAESAKLNAEKDMENFKNRVNQCQNLPGEIDGFAQQIRQKENKNARIEMCQILLAKANSLGKKKKFSKALNEEKKWAQTLKLLCDENRIPTI